MRKFSVHPSFLVVLCSEELWDEESSKLVSSIPFEFPSFPIEKGLDRVQERQEKGGQIRKMEVAPDRLNPSYTIVNKQLQDLVRVQSTVMARLKAMVR